MRLYSSLKKKSGSIAAAVISLAVCILLTAALLLSRLLTYSPAENIHRIPLTKSSGTTYVTPGPRGALPSGLPRMLTAGLLTANPGFEAGDKDGQWNGQTDVQIFSIHYNNATGETTVRSNDGAKVLAPGVGSVYEFALENTGNVALDYTLQMDAWFSHTEYPIPIFVTVTDHAGNYILGSDTEMVDVLRLSEVNEAGVISPGKIQPYTLTWEWPFELDDEYDTFLGNLAMDQDLTLTISIRTTAQYNDDGGSGGINPPTGDNSQIALYALLMLASLAGILLLLLLSKKEEKHEVS